MVRVNTQKRLKAGLRPFDIRYDLLPLADLIELTFQPELDLTANPIVSEMRDLARAGPLLWIFDASFRVLSPFLRGYVWVAEGQLVGNVSLTRENQQHSLWSISNVAVHPDFRGRGIARQLMKAAIQEAKQKGAQWVILEVQTDNAPARQLYQELGFQVYDTVAELSLPAGKYRERWPTPTLALRERYPKDWPRVYELLRVATPEAVQKVRPILSSNYRLTIRRRLARWLDNLLYLRQSQEWLLEENGQVVALLQVTGQYTKAAHHIQIHVHPDHRGIIEEELLASGLDWLSRFPEREVVSTVSTSHPEALQAFLKSGFRTLRLLDQMALHLRHPEE
ncbi:MAG: GNAT family N-acetyltransferase [Chloroflexi bacterium]|nr:GNAT family N-acetyltransferase [Chloroflexota bacterium]